MRKNIIVGTILGLLISVGFGIAKLAPSYDKTCITEIKKEIVEGSSMAPLINGSTEIEALFGYYDCNKVERNDIALVNTSMNKDLIIKSVKVLPGDKFSLERFAENDWRIVVNGIELKNSVGEPYSLTDGRSKMIALYEKEYGGVMKDGLYLVFGEALSGSLDSTRFGPIEKKDIVAKVASISP